MDLDICLFYPGISCDKNKIITESDKCHAALQVRETLLCYVCGILVCDLSPIPFSPTDWERMTRVACRIGGAKNQVLLHVIGRGDSLEGEERREKP